MPDTERRGFAFVALGALGLIWGYNWVVMKIGVRDASPFVFAAWRMFGGGVVLALTGLLLRRPMRPQYFGRTFWIGFFQSGCFMGLASWAVVTAGAGAAAMLAYTMPLWVALIAWPVLGERIGMKQAIAIALSFAGIAFMIGPLRAGAAADLMAVGAGLAWAVGIVIARQLQRSEKVDVFSLTTWQMLCGGAVLVVVALIVPSHPTVWTHTYIFAIAYNIFVSTALGYTLFLFALSVLPAGVASMGTLATPIVGVLAGWAQLGEVPGKREGIGMLLVVAGLVVLSLANRAQVLTPRKPHRVADDEQAR